MRSAIRWVTNKFIKVEITNFLEPKISLPEEYTVTGLYEYTGLSTSENAYRESLGLPRRPYYIHSKKKYPEEFEEEVKRRMFLGLPDAPKCRREELVFTPNRFNQKIDEWKFQMFLALDYADARKRFPKGYSGVGT
jgi:hypothetical protein